MATLLEKIQGARADGYSDKEIADFIAEQKKVDISSARADNYPDSEIVDYLVGELKGRDEFATNLNKQPWDKPFSLDRPPPEPPAPARRVSAPSPHTVPQAKAFDPYGGYYDPDRGMTRAPDDYGLTMAESLSDSFGEEMTMPSGSDWWNSLRGTLARQMQGYELNELESMEDEILGRSWPVGRHGMPKYSRTPEELRELQDDPMLIAIRGMIQEASAAGREITTEQQEIAARNPGYWANVLMTGTNSLASSALGLGATLLLKKPTLSLPLMYGPTAASEYGQMREEGIERGLADKASTAAGIIEAVTEFPAMRPFANEASPMLKRLGETIAADIPGETVAGLSQSVIHEVAAADPDASLLDPIATGLEKGLHELPVTYGSVLATAGAHTAIGEAARLPETIRNERMDRDANAVRDEALASAQNLLNMIRGPQSKLPFDEPAMAASPPPRPAGLGAPPSEQPTVDMGLLSSLVPQDQFAPELPLPDPNIQPPLPLGTMPPPATTGSPAPEGGAAGASAPAAPPPQGTASPPTETPLSSAFQQPAASPAPPLPNKPAPTPAPQAATADSTAPEPPAGGAASLTALRDNKSAPVRRYEPDVRGGEPSTKDAGPKWDELPGGWRKREYVAEIDGQRFPVQEIRTPGGKRYTRGTDLDGKPFDLSPTGNELFNKFFDEPAPAQQPTETPPAPAASTPTETKPAKEPRPISKWTDEELEQAAQQHDTAAQDSERMKDPGRAAKFREGAATLRAQKGKQAKPAKETPAPAKETKAAKPPSPQIGMFGEKGEPTAEAKLPEPEPAAETLVLPPSPKPPKKTKADAKTKRAELTKDVESLWEDYKRIKPALAKDHAYLHGKTVDAINDLQREMREAKDWDRYGYRLEDLRAALRTAVERVEPPKTPLNPESTYPKPEGPVREQVPNVAQPGTDEASGAVPIEATKDDFAEVINEHAQLFADPDVKVLATHHPDKSNPLTLEEADKRVQSWMDHAFAQTMDDGQRSRNMGRAVLSLFDLTGAWSQPYMDAGYNVIRVDLQDGHDIRDFSVEYIQENWPDVVDVYAILIAAPCTDFASSGALHFEKKDASGETEASKELVFQALRTVEYFRPVVWALENPTGRIERLTGLPTARYSFDPSDFSEPYTKKTHLWGKFATDLPVAPVEPTRGSKMHSEFGGKSQETKNARSETPEGFAYAFFMANNAEDSTAQERLVGEFPMAAGAIEKALEAGFSEAQIRKVMEDSNYDPGSGDAPESREALRELVKTGKPKPEPKAKVTPPPTAEQLAKKYKKVPAEAFQRAQDLGLNMKAIDFYMRHQDASDRTLATFEKYVLAVEMTKPGNYPYLHEPPPKPEKEKEGEKKKRRPTPKEAAKTKEDFGKTIGRHLPEWSWRKVPALAAGSPEAKKFAAAIDKGVQAVRDTYEIKNDEQRYWDYADAIADLRETVESALEAVRGKEQSREEAADEAETDAETETADVDEEVTELDDVGFAAAEEQFVPEAAEFHLPEPPPPRQKGAKRSSTVEKQVRQNIANAEQLHEEWTQLTKGDGTKEMPDWMKPFVKDMHFQIEGMRHAATYAEWAKHVADHRHTLAAGIEEAKKHAETAKDQTKKAPKAASKDTGIEASSLDEPVESTDTEGSSRTRGDGPFTPPSTPRENLMNEAGIDPTTFRLLGGKEQWKAAVDAIKQKYGFAGIFKHPSANWRDSVDHLLDAFESLQNMAEVMGQGNKVVSLGGKVHLYMREKPGKFGGYYRHKGGMSGEPDTTIAIFKQSDVFSHELGHALDYDLMERAGGTEAGGLSRMLRNHEPTSGLPKNTMEAYTNVITSLYYDAGDIAMLIKKAEHQLSKAKTPKRQAELQKRLDNLRSGAWRGRGSKTDFYKRAKDGPLADYLSKPTELFARAHEAYISWKIQSQQALGLVKFLGKPDAIYSNDADAWMKRIYPQAMDRQNIFAAFDNLYGSIAREMAYDTTANPGFAQSKLNLGLIDPVAQAKANGTPLTPDIIAAKNLTDKAATTYMKDEAARNDTMAKNIAQLWDDMKKGIPGSADKWHAFRKSLASTPDGIFKFLETRFPDIASLREIRDNLSDAHIHGRNKPVGVYREMQRAEAAITNRMEDRLFAVGIRRNMPKEWSSRMWDILHGFEKPANAEERIQADAIRYEFDYHWKMRDQTGEEIGYVEYEYMPRVMMRNVADDTRFHTQLRELRIAEKKELIAELERELKHTQDPEKRAALEAKIKEAEKIDPIQRTIDQIAKMKGLQWGEPVYLGALSEDSAKMRVFGPLADKILKDYYIKDPFTLLAGYGAAAARGKVMRDRFGGKPNTQFQKWLTDAVELPSAYSDLLVNAMQVSLGLRRDNNGVVSRAINAYTNVTVAAAMGRSVIPNLSEPLNVLSRSLDTGATFGQLMKAMMPILRNQKDKQRFATADRFGRLSGVLVDAASNMTAMAQAIGEDVQGNGTLAKFSMRAYWFNLTSGLTSWQEKVVNRIAFETFYEAARIIRKGGADAGMYRTWLKEHGVTDPAAFADFLKDHTSLDDVAFENTLDGMGRTLANASAQYTHTTIQKPTPSTKLIWAHSPVVGAMARLTSWITTNSANWRDNLIAKSKSAITGKYGDEKLTSKQRMQAMVYPVAAAAVSMYVAQATFLIARMLLTNSDEWESRGEDFWDRFWSRKTQIQIVQYWGVLGWLMNTTADVVAGTRFNRGPVSTLLGPSYGGAEQDAERLIKMGVAVADMITDDKLPSNATKNNAAQAVIHNVSLLAMVGLLTVLPASKKPAIVTGFLASFYGTSPQFQRYLADQWAGEKTAKLREKAAKGDRVARRELAERKREAERHKTESKTDSKERPK